MQKAKHFGHNDFFFVEMFHDNYNAIFVIMANDQEYVDFQKLFCSPG